MGNFFLCLISINSPIASLAGRRGIIDVRSTTQNFGKMECNAVKKQPGLKKINENIKYSLFCQFERAPFILISVNQILSTQIKTEHKTAKLKILSNY